MTTVLRPMNTGEVLDRTFNLYRNNFWLFVGIAMFPAALRVAWQVIDYANRPDAQFAREQPFAAENIIPTLLGLLIAVFVMAIETAATVYAVSMVHLEKKTTIIQCYRGVLPHLFRVFAVVLFTVLILGILAFALIGLPAGLVLAAASRATSFSFFMVLLVVIVGGVVVVHVYARYSLAPAACVVEKAGPLDSLRRSLQLTKNAAGRIWLILLLYLVIIIGLGFLFGTPAKYLGEYSGSFIVATALMAVAEFLTSVLAAPILAVPLVLTYYDQRVRNEAFDLQLMMEAIGQATPAEATAAPLG